MLSSMVDFPFHCVCMCVYIYIYMCVCVCLCKYVCMYRYRYRQTHTYISEKKFSANMPVILYAQSFKAILRNTQSFKMFSA